MAFRLLPKDDSFFDLFEQMASRVVESARALEEMMVHWDRLEERVRAIKDLETAADKINHAVTSKLNSTFITPLEREDIHSLAGALDDIADHIEGVAKSVVLYAVKVPTDEAKLLTQILSRTCVEVQKAVHAVRNLQETEVLTAVTTSIHQLENESDDIHRLAVKHLFANPTDIVELIKLKEIYERLEKAVDKCEDVADVIQAVALRNS